MSKKVLFVDDEQKLLNALQRRYGFDYDITTAVSGERALHAMHEQGPFAVIVTDMRMPEMDGVQFIAHARQLSPDSTYIMLTGNQDQETAIKALNDGRVFRFLNKPCDNEAIRIAVEAGLRQYELVTGERDLLKKTFCGAVGVLTDLLEGSHPEFYSCAAGIEDLVAHLRDSLEIEDRWEYRLASKLCLIGFAILPESAREDYAADPSLNAHWMESLEKACQEGMRMIQRIPRLESVAAIIGSVPRVDGGAPLTGATSRAEVEAVGATLLRIALHVDRLASIGMEAATGAAEIRVSLPGLGPEAHAALEAAWPETASKPTIELPLSELREGMVLAESVRSADGATLVRRGRRLTDTIIDKLRCHKERIVRQGQLKVFEHSLNHKQASRLSV